MNTYPITVDDAVTVGDGTDWWKVFGIENGFAHLSKLNSFHRLDWRGVAVERLTRAGSQ